MITNTHTPGPWIAKAAQVYCQASGETIAVIPGVRSDDPTPANAELIAAAPRLLAAAELLYAELIKAGYGKCDCENFPEPCAICTYKAAIANL